jgi:hypothetical protein
VELKAIARAAVNKESAGMSRAAMAVYNQLAGGGKLGARALGAAARKVVPGLVAFSFGSAAIRGYAGENIHGHSGVVGAADELAREAMCADLVESFVFPQVRAASDAALKVVVPGEGGLEAARERLNNDRYGDQDRYGVP